MRAALLVSPTKLGSSPEKLLLVKYLFIYVLLLKRLTGRKNLNKAIYALLVYIVGGSMSSHLQSSSNGPNPWPTILLFIAAIGVPGSAALAFANTVSKNPWQVAGI